jgi:hypothetical protein
MAVPAEQAGLQGHPELPVRALHRIPDVGRTRRRGRDRHHVGVRRTVEAAESRRVEHPDTAEVRRRETHGRPECRIVDEGPVADLPTRVDPEQSAGTERPGDAVRTDRQGSRAREREHPPARRLDDAARQEGRRVPDEGVRRGRGYRARHGFDGRRRHDRELVDTPEELAAHEDDRDGGREEEPDDRHDPDQAQGRGPADGRQDRPPERSAGLRRLGDGRGDRLGQIAGCGLIGPAEQHRLESRVGQDRLGVHRSSASRARSRA